MENKNHQPDGCSLQNLFFFWLI